MRAFPILLVLAVSACAFSPASEHDRFPCGDGGWCDTNGNPANGGSSTSGTATGSTSGASTSGASASGSSTSGSTGSGSSTSGSSGGWKAAGAACDRDEACRSGICGGSFCCVSRCGNGPCGTSTCDATGACVYPATECAAASCSAGTETAAASCANGICPTPATHACAPYACGGTACKTACTTAADCASCHDCESGVCVAADTRTDPANCGGCDNACPSGAACAAGTCECVIGGSDYADGGAAPGNACEYCNVAASATAWTNAQDGTACDGGWTCHGGACVGSPPCPVDEAWDAGAGACVLAQWADWPMPNPADAGLPNPARYDTATPNVVVDKVTGLAWEQPPGSSAALTWSAASAYCAGLTTAGHHDWRLPTVIELRSLVDFTVGNPGPTIDLTAFPGTQGNYFWSATPQAGSSPMNAWYVEFAHGWSWVDAVTATLAVRCVRGSAARLSAPRYDVSEGTVKDNETGLVWQQALADDSNGQGWNAAMDYCRTLTLAGGGWRVPSVKELSSLVDFTVESPGPTIDTTVFPGTPNGWFWTSSLVAGNFSDAWCVVFKDGGLTDNNGVSLPYRVRCVR